MIEVPLKEGRVALLDDEDAWIIRVFPKWYLRKRGNTEYARRGGLGMHRLVMRLDMDGFSSPGIVDHINGNGLDNRRCNLRICTHIQNMWNRGVNKNSPTGFRGVRVRRKRFYAAITINGKTHHLGSYATAKEAGAAYDAAAKRMRGEFYREAK